jgi:CarD family transcriptional regulator
MAVKKAPRAGARSRKTVSRRPAAGGARATASKGRSARSSRPKPLSPRQQKAYIDEIKTIVKQRAQIMKGFRVGETVVEPSIGVCRIEGIKSQMLDAKMEDYYIFNSGTARVYVPMSQIEKRGVRRPMSRDEIRRISGQLKLPVSPSRTDARMQYLSYREVMKSGDPGKIAKLLRELFTLDKMDELKGKEKEIMEQAKKFLVDEISFVREEPKAKIQEDIQACLDQMYKRKLTKDKEARARRAAAASS